jgi:hypothetical protein
MHFGLQHFLALQSRLLATKMGGMAKFLMSAGAPARNVIRDGIGQAPPPFIFVLLTVLLISNLARLLSLL